MDSVPYPGKAGLWPPPGRNPCSCIPERYLAAASDWVLRCAVCALAVADMPEKRKDHTSSHHTKEQRRYGLALCRRRELAGDEASIIDNRARCCNVQRVGWPVSGVVRIKHSSIKSTYRFRSLVFQHCSLDGNEQCINQTKRSKERCQVLTATESELKPVS